MPRTTFWDLGCLRQICKVENNFLVDFKMYLDNVFQRQADSLLLTPFPCLYHPFTLQCEPDSHEWRSSYGDSHTCARRPALTLQVNGWPSANRILDELEEAVLFNVTFAAHTSLAAKQIQLSTTVLHAKRFHEASRVARCITCATTKVSRAARSLRVDYGSPLCGSS